VARSIRLLPTEYKSVARLRTVEDRHAALCSELGHLRAEVKRLEGVIKFKDDVISDQVRFLEGVLRENKEQSIEGMKRRISRLKGALDREQGGLPE